MTRENTVGTCPYIYSDEVFYGFMATHQPAQWMGESGEIVVCPGLGEVKTSFSRRGLSFSHDNEVTTPSYYQTKLYSLDDKSCDDEITAEITSTSRASSMRFTYDSTTSAYVTVQVTRKHINGEVFIDVDNQEVSGYNPERQGTCID